MTGKNSASSASTGSVSHDARRNSRRYVKREATSAPMSAGSASSIPASHFCESSPTVAKPGSTSRSRCTASGMVVGVAGDRRTPTTDRVDARARRGRLGHRNRYRSPGGTRARCVQPADCIDSAKRASYASARSRMPGSTRIRRSGATRNALERGRETGMGGERGVGIGPALSQHVEGVTGEDDHRGPAATFDRVRDRPGHLPGDVGPTRREP